MSRMGILMTAVAMIAIVACVPTPQNTQTQLQVRQFQTRSYSTGDMAMVMRAVLNVLQDDGYIITTANSDLGVLAATREIDIESTGEAILASAFMGAQARWKKNMTMEVTANVSPYGNECRVRANFQTKTHDNRGAVMEVKQIGDEQFYTEFFSRVDKGIFIEDEGL